MEEKLISVIVPVYKVEKYLDKCVESIVNQIYKNLEIILVDDGSLDNCPAMCDAWAQRDNRIKVIHKENGGLSDARNTGYRISTGEYISFIDSDDWIEREFYSMLARELDKGVDIAECATDWCDENNKSISIRGFSEPKVLDTVEATQTLLQENGIMQTVWNKLYKRKCVENIPFEKDKFHEDNFWTWKTFLKASSVSVITKPMYHYVQRKSGIMGMGYSLKRLDALEADFKCYSVLKDNENYKSIVTDRLVGACMYHLQRSLKDLSGEEKEKAKNIILSFCEDLNFNRVKFEYKWYNYFLKTPVLVAKIRNFLNMGI